MGVTIDADGNEQAVGSIAKENGVYRTVQGVPVQVMAGDPIPLGAKPVDQEAPADAPATGKARTGPANTK